MGVFAFLATAVGLRRASDFSIMRQSELILRNGKEVHDLGVAGTRARPAWGRVIVLPIDMGVFRYRTHPVPRADAPPRIPYLFRLLFAKIASYIGTYHKGRIRTDQ